MQVLLSQFGGREDQGPEQSGLPEDTQMGFKPRQAGPGLTLPHTPCPLQCRDWGDSQNPSPQQHFPLFGIHASQLGTSDLAGP